ncbi:MAG TPA: hypothetical protein VI932_03665, partial [Bacteroidota bacterium]|nr:hypothetical protein [Bacteroidota bacterium]
VSGWLAAKRDRKYYLLLLIPVLYLVMLASWKMRADRYIFPAIPFLLMIAAVGITRSLEAITLRIGSRWKTGIAAPASAKAYAAGIVVVLLMIPSFRAVTGYQRTAGLPDTRTAAVEWIGGNAKPGSAIAAGPFGIELSKTKYITLPIQFTAVNSERMTPFYNPEWYKDVDLVVVSDFDYGRYRNEPERFREILGYLDTLRSSWELVRSFEPGDSLTGPAIRLYRYPGEVTDEPFPSQLPGQLLASELETERKVAFLGKLGLILSVQGKLTRSEQLFKILLSLEPDNETAKKALGGLRAFRASPGKTDNRVAGKASREPAAAGALVAEGDSLFAIGNLDDAEKSYRDALGKDRNQVNAYLGLTMIYAARDERNKVVRTLKELLSILPPGSEDYARVQGQLKSIEGDNP